MSLKLCDVQMYFSCQDLKYELLQCTLYYNTEVEQSETSTSTTTGTTITTVSPTPNVSSNIPSEFSI
jgi:hypothetical protein